MKIVNTDTMTAAALVTTPAVADPAPNRHAHREALRGIP